MIAAILPLIYLAALAGAEAVTALVGPVWGIIFHFVILFLLIVSSSTSGEHGIRIYLLCWRSQSIILRDPYAVDQGHSHRLFLALGLAPLIRIVSLAMPLAEFSQIYWYLIIAVPLLAGIFAVIVTLDLRPRDIGLTADALPIQGLVALTGMGFGMVEYLILRPEPLILALRWQEVIVPALILLVATGFVEELAFRGVMQRSAQVLGSWGWIYIAVVFSVLQIGHLSALHWLFVLAVSLFFGWIVKRTGSILGVSLSHGLTNVCLFLIFPFVIS